MIYKVLVSVLAGTVIGLLFTIDYLRARIRQMQSVMFQHAKKAERDGNKFLRIPFNDALSLFRLGLLPMRLDNWSSKPGKHPAVVTPARRRKLGGRP